MVSSRREIKQIPQLLETDDETPLAFISNSRGLQNTICTATNSVAQSNNTNVTRRPITRKCSNRSVFSRRNDRGITISKSKFPVKILYHSRKNKKKAYFRLSKPKQIYSDRTFQDGGSPSFERNHQARQLYVQNRSKRCIRRHTNTPRFHGLFNFHKPRHRVQVSLPGF